MAVNTISDQNFEQSVQGNTPVLVDFWASWCGPCKMLSPIIDELAEELSDKLVVGKLNVDENPKTAQKYGIMSIPTLLVFKNGQVVKQLNGYMPKADLKAKLADVL